ncbi:hypothetical protein DXC71_06475 [Bifidobacterium pseudocatenulatum]|nr:hypothetical protein DXC71_06475 [Bifidobacterium pseudocatenulatum]
MFRYMKLAFRKDVYYQSFSQNTKVAFNNAFVRRCKKSLIFSLAAFRTLELSTRIRKPHIVAAKSCVKR